MSGASRQPNQLKCLTHPQVRLRPQAVLFHHLGFGNLWCSRWGDKLLLEWTNRNKADALPKATTTARHTKVGAQSEVPTDPAGGRHRFRRTPLALASEMNSCSARAVTRRAHSRSWLRSLPSWGAGRRLPPGQQHGRGQGGLLAGCWHPRRGHARLDHVRCSHGARQPPALPVGIAGRRADEAHPRRPGAAGSAAARSAGSLPSAQPGPSFRRPADGELNVGE